MMQLTRIALFFCSHDEANAVRSHVGEHSEVALETWEIETDVPFDFAILGSVLGRRPAVLHVLRERLHVPAAFLLGAEDADPFLTEDFASLAVTELRRLPYVIARELRLHRTERALRESEQRYRQLVDQAQQGVWATDTAARTTFANQKLADMLGESVESLHGRSIFDFISDVSRVDAVRNLHRAGHDVRFRRRNGSEFWGLLTTSPLFDDDGRYIGAMALVSDITDRKEMEEALRERERELLLSEQRNRSVLAGIPAVIWSADRGDGYYISPGIEQLWGYSADEVCAGGVAVWLKHVHPLDRTRVLEAHDALFDGGPAMDVEYRLRRKDGRWIRVHERAVLSGDTAYGVMNDVTAAHEAAEALRRSETRYRTLVEQATDIIFSVDGEGRMASLNPAFERITGWAAAEWIGRPFAEVLDPSSHASAQEAFETIVSGGAAPGREYRLKTKSGDAVTIEATAQALVTGGEVVGTIGIARDVTRRKAADAEVEREKRLASLGQLAAAVAHEFNNVLMSILPFAELLKRRLPEEATVGMATSHITQAVKRGRQVSQEILRFSRPTAPAMTLIDVGEWLKGFAVEARATVDERYTLEVSSEEGLFVEADRTLIDQVATNLVVNARDAMSGGGAITIRAHRAADGSVAVAVTDRGRGIPAPLLDRIFDPLFTTKAAGNGLGLTIASQAMTLQHGTLRVTSTEGEGSTFTMLLPSAQAPRPAESAKPAASDRRILLVEDDEAVAHGLASLLVDYGFETKLVMRGGEAEKAVAEFSPDVVLLDVNLPDMSGLEVHEQLVARWPSLSVILSTGHTDARALDAAQRKRVPAIQKPYDVETLLTTMAEMG